MKGQIYKITNLLNGKAYIGKTFASLNRRFSEHKAEAKRSPHRPLYRAFIKYGTDNFIIESLGFYNEEDLSTEEEKAIEAFGTFGSKGYNATKGGDGSRYLALTDAEILQAYEQLGQVELVHQSLKIDHSTIRKVLRSNKVDIIQNHGLGKKRVRIIECDCEFDSLRDCAVFLQEHELTQATDPRGIAAHIRKVANGARKSYLGFTYEFI